MASSATGSNQRSWYHLHARFGSIQLLSFALILTEFAVFFSLSISYLIFKLRGGCAWLLVQRQVKLFTINTLAWLIHNAS